MKAWLRKKACQLPFTKILAVCCLYIIFSLLVQNNEKEDDEELIEDKQGLIEWVKQNDAFLKSEYAARSKLAREVCQKYDVYMKQNDYLKKSDTKSLNIPYSDWLALKRINWQTIFFSNYENFVYCKVPKSGSSNWVYYMLKLAGLPEDEIHTDIGIHKLLRDYYPKIRDQNAKKHFMKAFKFMVARHPFERVLSAYRDKLESYKRDLKYRNGYYYTLYGKNIVKIFRDKSDPLTVNQTEPTWTEFVRYLIETPYTKFDEHWKPIYSLCSPCNMRYHVIAKMETFSEDTQYVINKLSLEERLYVEWIHKTSNESTSSIARKYYSQLTANQVDRLYDKYRLDFELFGYDHEIYRDMSKT